MKFVRIPIYMRIGDNPDHLIGWVVEAKPDVPALLREVSDEWERQCRKESEEEQ